MTYYKLLTHDLRPPIEGGDPIWDGKTLPFELPHRKHDTSGGDCGAGWNFVDDLAAGFRIAGLWPTGRPSRVLIVEPDGGHVQRGEKYRSSHLTILREATEAEITEGIAKLSSVFGEHAKAMVEEQIAWRRYLARPAYDEGKVEAGLRRALMSRSLAHWQLRRFDSARDARDAWEARGVRGARDAGGAGAAWDAGDAWDARGARAAKDVWAAWAAWDARAAWGAWGAREAREARAAWDARAARDALKHFYAVHAGWLDAPDDQFTVGIRDAYEHGLEIAIPVGQNVLGWAMMTERESGR